MTTYSRSDWGARAPKGGPGSLDPSEVEGIALHWPAMKSPLRTPADVKAALRGWQNYHMDGHGWSDIAYQVAVDQDGNRYELRGLRTQSGANGDAAVNQRFGAILLVLAPGEEPSAAMMREARAVIAEHRALFPKSRRVVGHSQIRPEGTACPGPIVQRLINAGAFNTATAPVPEEEDLMAILDEALNANDPKGRAETQNVTVREALIAMVIEASANGAPQTKAYLDNARQSKAG